MSGRRWHIDQQSAPVAVARRGFSLLELIIVVSIIAFIGVMAAPNIVSQMKENRVAQAAESVRGVIAQARGFAIDAGIDYQFRYEVNGQHFIVIPRELESGAETSIDTDVSTANYLRLSGELDEDFHLLAPEDSDEERIESLESAWFGQLPDTVTLSQANWSAPIVFYFDGRADDAAFRVATDDKLTADITVRGLTGSISVSQVYPEDQ